MYNVHYGYAVHKYGRGLRLLLADTHSLMYFIETSDLYRDMQGGVQLFNTSDNTRDHDTAV